MSLFVLSDLSNSQLIGRCNNSKWTTIRRHNCGLRNIVYRSYEGKLKAIYKNRIWSPSVKAQGKFVLHTIHFKA
uniref:Uncharacterized protein n=1 Tax=Helianthus annuus TaxID=4232 RepID=A0A251T1X9_HELAN